MQIEDAMVVAPTRESSVAKLWEQNQDIVIDDWLQALLDQTIEVGQRLWDKERDYFRPSASGDLCERSMTFSLYGHTVPVPARVKRIFRTGNKIEESIIEVLKQAGVHISSGTRFQIKGPPFHGMVDVIIAQTSDGERLLGEIKSIKQENFDKLPKPSSNPAANVRNLAAGMHRGYMCQCQIYLEASRLKTGFILFECKNTSRQLVFWLVRDQMLLDEIYRLCGVALEYKKRRMIAPTPVERRPENRRDPGCQYCNHKYLCVRVDPGEVHIDEVKRVDLELRGAS